MNKKEELQRAITEAIAACERVDVLVFEIIGANDSDDVYKYKDGRFAEYLGALYDGVSGLHEIDSNIDELDDAYDSDYLVSEVTD